MFSVRNNHSIISRFSLICGILASVCLVDWRITTTTSPYSRLTCDLVSRLTCDLVSCDLLLRLHSELSRTTDHLGRCRDYTLVCSPLTCFGVAYGGAHLAQTQRRFVPTYTTHPFVWDVRRTKTELLRFSTYKPLYGDWSFVRFQPNVRRTFVFVQSHNSGRTTYN